MKEFFKVTNLKHVLEYTDYFEPVGTEVIALHETCERILGADVFSDVDLPDFTRSTRDGYAVCAQSTFGASEGNPAYLTIKGQVEMGTCPDFSIGPGEAAKIATGGMLPVGADSIVMIEYTEEIDADTIEAYRSVAPGQYAIEIGEDMKKGETILSTGQKLRPQETGLLAAFGKETIKVYKKPVISIISTGDEVVGVNEIPGPGQIRDINTYTLSGLVKKVGGIPVSFGIVKDNFNDLLDKCSQALAESDMVLISGGSSVGMRDFTIEVLSSLPDSKILAHGVSISPGKPTILASADNKPFLGLPGHVVSAMIVFEVIVKSFINKIGGLSKQHKREKTATALLNRNISSAQGRTDYIRVRLIEKDGILWAEPVLGKAGLINTMIKADGIIEIGLNAEGLDKGSRVSVFPM